MRMQDVGTHALRQFLDAITDFPHQFDFTQYGQTLQNPAGRRRAIEEPAVYFLFPLNGSLVRAGDMECLPAPCALLLKNCQRAQSVAGPQRDRVVEYVDHAHETGFPISSRTSAPAAGVPICAG